jgi:hypothetical protein
MIGQRYFRSRQIRKAVPLGAVMALALFSTTSEAQRAINLRVRTASDLAQLCAANPRDPRGDAAINFCHGFAQGTVDVLLGISRANKPFCFPNPPPTRTATLAQFVEWVRAAPAHASLPAARALAQFLHERFPC